MRRGGFVAATVVVALAAVIAWRMHARGARARGDADAETETAVAPAPASAADVTRLRGEVAGLRAELALAAARGRAEGRASDAAAPAPAVPPPAPNNDAVTAKVENAFARERPDPRWSEAAAATIARELDGAGLSAAFRGVTCATTMCKIDLALDDPELRANLAERVTALDALQTEIVYVHHAGDPPTVTLYAARADHPLPL